MSNLKRNIAPHSCGSADVIRANHVDEYTATYVPPVQEFEVANTALPPQTTYNLPILRDGSILLVLSGHCIFTNGSQEPVDAQEVWFLPYQIYAHNSACRAGVNLIYWRWGKRDGTIKPRTCAIEPGFGKSIV